MRTDFHIHSSFSADSDTSMEDMVRAGIRKGLSVMCFTEHMDIGFPGDPDHAFEVDTNAYRRELLRLKELYKEKVTLLFGIELGLQPHLTGQHRSYLSQWPFDFVIGSSHLVNGQDPYYPEFFRGKEEAGCYRSYFQSVLENLEAFPEIDVYGHLDYVVRYGPNQDRFYSYAAYRDILEEILKKLIEKQVGLEVNTAGLAYGMAHPNPCEDILRRYRELGGEVLTVGSDGHSPERLAWEFPRIRELLKACGFRYYTVFQNRSPAFLPL